MTGRPARIHGATGRSRTSSSGRRSRSSASTRFRSARWPSWTSSERGPDEPRPASRTPSWSSPRGGTSADDGEARAVRACRVSRRCSPSRRTPTRSANSCAACSASSGCVEAAVLLLALLIAFNSASINADERAREEATMFAFGLRPRTVLRIAIDREPRDRGPGARRLGLGVGWLLLDWLVTGLLPQTYPGPRHRHRGVAPAPGSPRCVLGVVAVTAGAGVHRAEASPDGHPVDAAGDGVVPARPPRHHRGACHERETPPRPSGTT